MRHAHATVSEERWAGPTIGVEAATAAENAVVAAKEVVNAMTAPTFKPFVFVPLSLPGDPGDWTVVEDTGVFMNSDGDLVATLEDESNNKRLFVWWDEGHYNGSTTTFGWQGPVKNASNNPIVMHSTGVAGINSSDEICGTRDDSGPTAFDFVLTDLQALKGSVTDLDIGYAGDINDAGVIVGTTDGNPTAWSDMYAGPVTLPPLTGGSSTAALGVEPGGGLTPFIAGQSKDDGAIVQAVVWYNSSGWQVVDLSGLEAQDDAIGIATAVNDDGHIVGAILDDTSFDVEAPVIWLYDSGSWSGEVITSALADFLPRAVNNEEYPEAVGSHYLWKATNLAAFAGVTLDLLDLTTNLPEGLIGITAWDINDAGEICGIAELDDETVPRLPFKIVPYDTDNNESPDFREIILNPSLDDDDDWLLDRSELIRVGLHAPGYDNGPPHQIPNTQIVRLQLHLTELPVDSEPGEAYALEDILDPQAEECDFRADIKRWGSDSGGREIVIWLRSSLESQYTDYDFLPANQQDEDAILANLRVFGSTYARCIDWVQTGNEVFGGAGQYAFRQGELSCGQGLFSGLSSSCKAEAIEEILEWLDKQMRAVLEGSALGGRPLRMISPGVSHENVYNGYEAGSPTDPGRYLTTRVAEWCNERQMYFDMHTHWIALTMPSAAPDRLMGTNGATPPWDPPNWAVALEWGPMVEQGSDWYNENGDEFDKFHEDSGCDEDPGYYWDAFVASWRTAQFGQGNPFGMDDVLGAFRDAGFTVGCYGPTVMHSSPNFIYDIAAQIATQVCEDYLDPNRQPDPRATLCYDEYQDVATGGSYMISNFSPHGTPCPTCPQ